MIRMTPPTVAGLVTGVWGDSRDYRGGWHAGLDFPAPKGSPMLAAADGVVAYVRHSSPDFAGKFVVIDHGDGVYSRYLHADTITVAKGQPVIRGQQLGTVGTTGTSRSAPHVHFDVKLSSDALARYQAAYGAPVTGFSGKTSFGQGAPAETFMDKATYKEGLKERSQALGVVFYKGGLVMKLVLTVGLAYLASRFVR